MRPEYDFSTAERGRFFHPNAKLTLPVRNAAQDWAGRDSDLGAYIAEESRKTLNAYADQPHLILEHANHEQDTARGGYAHRQLFELIQNAADALSGASAGGRIAIRLTDGHLYCADDGEPINQDGVTALMFSHLSPKRGTSEIGRFGLGFKSVLGVTDAPEFFSRAGSFRFDRQRAWERIREVAPDVRRYPVLRLAEPVDPHEARDSDPVLSSIMGWATNIVRLPIEPSAAADLRQQMHDFPPPFLLFVEHVGQLRIDDGSTLQRVLELEEADGEFRLVDGGAASAWKLFKVIHRLSSDARADRRSLDDGDEVPIWWAAPLARLTDPGVFWAYFPTRTASLVAGILNAPWKTNEDRQNLLPGPYNDALIDAAAEMVADRLPELATDADPARHLDALPRRHEAGDPAHSDRLRHGVLAGLCERPVVPDQSGTLRTLPSVRYPPQDLTDRTAGAQALDEWAQYAGRPSGWLHRRAFPRTRLARIEQLCEQWASANGHPQGRPWRASIAEWLEALVEGKAADAAVEASRAAILTAAAIPRSAGEPRTLGGIVLTQSGAWRSLDPEHVFLPRDAADAALVANADELVHAALAGDADAHRALRGLGVALESAESRLRLMASKLLGMGTCLGSDDNWHRFWSSTREVEVDSARRIICEQQRWRSHLRVRTQAGAWEALHRVLLPGGIVPGPDGRDRRVSVDLQFHEDDEELLDGLGAVAEPQGERELCVEGWFRRFEEEARSEFRARPLPSQPHGYLLMFGSTRGAGPLDVLDVLSDEGCADYTNALLALDSTYHHWSMRHDTRPDHYPAMRVGAPALRRLRASGRVRTANGVVRFEDALGEKPKSPEARDALLNHPKADRIKAAFDLVEPAALAPEFFGEDDPVPLCDVWPGFWPVLERRGIDCSNIDQSARLVRCERILVGGQERPWALLGANGDPVAPMDSLRPGRSSSLREAAFVYLKRSTDGDGGLVTVLRLVRGLADEPEDGLLRIAGRILEYSPPPTVEELRAAIRLQTTEAERLLKAVGESALRARLPGSLLAILDPEGAPLAGVGVAEAAIATHHTGALKHYRHSLEHLDPPRQWAGSPRAVDFVRSLGFSADWAGERNVRRAPFVEVEGPYSLPVLHDYQKIIVNQVRSMLRGVENGRGWLLSVLPGGAAQSENGGGRRGMISLPTGSGKTRVAVQAIVEAMRDDGFEGCVLWVADRDELCEQAVEAWRQVWSSIGAGGVRLRISRMWAGQPVPLATSDVHVVVATIQTLRARFKNLPGEVDFLTESTLVVFDEAHRSVAPTFTSVMQEIGLTRWQREDEPFLLGLTATPYRGHDEEETARLVKRYGGRRLDAGAFTSDDPQDVVAELQDMHVLALADHQTIEGGSYRLNEDERAEMDRTPQHPWLPQSVEDRIARDSDRTNRIVEAYQQEAAHADWPVLVFATSVEHAQTIAALLSRRGTPSRAVSGETEPATRRRIVEGFRHGDIKVLVNYGVFREGFDAPKTRVIVVARPVYSPNLYFQMIGRGLRGPRNGGTDRCLIVNVQDNIDNLERKLAFSDLDWLWA